MELFNSSFVQNYKEDFFNNKNRDSTYMEIIQLQMWKEKWM